MGVYLILSLFSASFSRAHGDLDLHIEELTARLAQAPSDAALWLQRADLHVQHRNWSAAENDLAAVERLAPATVRLALRRAELAAAQAHWSQALAAFDRAVAAEPDAPILRLKRARAHAASGAVDAALADFDFALARLTDPRPENFLERARLCENARRPADALAGLDDGIARLGPLPVFHLYALEIERRLGRPLEAVRRVDALLAQSERRERWFALRGELLAAGDRHAEARSAFRAALREIDALPPRLAALDDMRALRASLSARLTATAD